METREAEMKHKIQERKSKKLNYSEKNTKKLSDKT